MKRLAAYIETHRVKLSNIAYDIAIFSLPLALSIPYYKHWWQFFGMLPFVTLILGIVLRRNSQEKPPLDAWKHTLFFAILCGLAFSRHSLIAIGCVVYFAFALWEYLYLKQNRKQFADIKN